ncbi:MFS general substrate transporter [Coniochaeta ligniaria NRRL 30616]|uniref:MFS general substrate transporter n=1 Tax=Coniochaeta ligniaria NRRL 30616 TaxID=1408157 RepID=A0A1J7IK79_9PEZI|nr:MFS general substrate transporter [Coniochaeta ligniaria NRRL 30616]
MASDKKVDPDAIAPVPSNDETLPVARQKRDKAAGFLATVSEDVTSFTYEEEKSVLRKIDRRVLPILLLAYFFQQLDKSSLSYVSIFGLTDDAHLVGQQYSWLGSILYLAQLVMQPLAAFLLVKLPTGKIIAVAIFFWGTSLTLMSACTNFPSLLGLRFCLGTFEAMIAPSCIAVTQMWFRRSEQTMRNSLWNGMNGLTAIVGSLVTYGLGSIHQTSLFKYQIIFMFCGLFTVTYSVFVFFLMPDSPMEAKFLSEREKVIAVERLRANQMGIISREWRWDHVLETFLDPKTYMWFFLILSISIPSGGISTFGNLVVKSFGYTAFQAILFNIPFGVIQIISIVGGGWMATKIKSKGWTIVFFTIPSVVGTVIMLTVSREKKGVLLFGYYLVSMFASITPLVYAFQAQNTAGDTKRKCTSAVVFVGMCVGNVVGPQLYSPSQAPEYRPGLTANLILFVIEAIISILCMLYLKFLNKRHARQREQAGKSANVVDESMMDKSNVRSGKAVAIELEEAGQTNARAIAEDKGFDDTTDLENEDFIYVY